MRKVIAKLALLVVVLMPTMGLVVWFGIGDIDNGGFVAIAAAIVWLACYSVVLSTDYKAI